MEWDRVSRQSVDFASSASSLAFSAAKSTTRFGFAVTRGIASATASLTTNLVDLTLFGGAGVTRPLVTNALGTALSFAEQVTLAPIFLTEYITSTSLLAAHSSINVLSAFFPGSSDASFSLASFLDLVKREWPNEGQNAPPRQFPITKVLKAIVAWSVLQEVTQEYQERLWFKHLKEINVQDPPRNLESLRARRGSRVRVTSDVIFPGNAAQIIAADIGDLPPARAQSIFTNQTFSSRAKAKRPALDIPRITPPRLSSSLGMSNKQLKSTLRRLSKMVLAGYGGASLLFFGISPSAAHSRMSKAQRAREEQQLADAIDASEAQARGEFSELDDVDATIGNTQYSWWDVLLGKHDHEIFESFANSPEEPSSKAGARKIQESIRATAVSGAEHLMPRFWVLTDHSRGQIVLVLRGTMSLNEIAVDLTCDPSTFEPATTAEDEEEEQPIPGEYISPSAVRFPSQDEVRSTSDSQYHVHGGMLRMARAMGDIGKPVQLAVQEALHKNPGYVLCGHSLGAGVAAILGLMWSDPRTCLTVRASGLPVKRRVSVYCFGPPSLFDAGLCQLASQLITSLVYSHDVVARLSLGSVRDLKNASMWLCEANEGGGEGGYSSITRRADRWRAGQQEDMDWFIAIRKTLEANMHMADMFPPGRVLWAVRDNYLHPSHRRPETHHTLPDKLRLFEVLDVEKVFGQILFAKDMLSAHMPHNYDTALHDLL